MKSPISATNPIHRLRALQEEHNRLLMKLAPFYAAADLIEAGVETLEHLPAFRPSWERTLEIRREMDQIQIDLAIAYEIRRETLR
jgi:hypothetical protein